MQKVYRLRERAPQEELEKLGALPEVVGELLWARGVRSAQEAARFLSPDFLRDSHDPFLLPDMREAAERIVRAARAGEHVAVWSDYDCDGIPGGVMLAEFLRAVGCVVSHYIPHRHEEGYGLNLKGIDKLADSGASLLVTVDLGITDAPQTAHACGRGMDVIITDHHTVPEKIPEALAVVNPHRSDNRYPFPDLCGAGVAWKLVQATLTLMREQGEETCPLKEGQEKWLLDLVGLATLSDMVPLVGENRMLAHFGLRVMRKNRRTGFRSLLSLARTNAAGLTEDDAAFTIAPRINAASRMDSPETAAQLLRASDADEARTAAAALQALNDERKGVVAAIVKEVRKRLREEKDRGETHPLIVMGNPNWLPGVLGLAAQSVMQTEDVPIFLWGRSADTLKGSCRSTDVHVVEMMREASDVLLGFGGHEFAGGFSLAPERAHELAPALRRALEVARAKEMSADELQKENEILVDRSLRIQDAEPVLRDVSLLAPFGIGNPKPLFIIERVVVSRLRTFGREGAHLEITLMQQGAFISAISFFTTADSFAHIPRAGETLDVVAHLEKDFRGRARLRIVAIL